VQTTFFKCAAACGNLWLLRAMDHGAEVQHVKDQACQDRWGFMPVESDEHEQSMGSDLEALTTGPQGSMLRCAKPFALVATVALVGTLGLLYGLSPRQTAGTGVPTDGFVGEFDVAAHDAASAAPASGIKPKAKLCQEELVMDICLRMQAATPVQLPAGTGRVHEVALAVHFMVTRRSIDDFLDNIGLAKEWRADGYVKCQDLCEHTRASFPTNALPSLADVGCYYTPTSENPVCSVDLALAQFEAKDMTFNFFPKAAAVALGDQLPVHLSGKQKNWTKIMSADKSQWSKERIAAFLEREAPDVTYMTLQKQVSKLFRMYPASKEMTTSQRLDDYTLARQLKFAAKPVAAKNDMCETAKDGKCDFQTCPDGTDCTDCGTCSGEVYNDACIYSLDGFCDEERFCPRGTDCTDCDTCPDGYTKTDAFVEVQPADWPVMVLEMGVRASAMASVALTALSQPRANEVLKTWLGTAHSGLKAQVRHAITGILRMLDDVEYEFPGDKCEADTYAYTIPGEPKDKNFEGQFVIYLCEKFMKADLKVQLWAIFNQISRLGDILAEVQHLTEQGAAVYGKDKVKELANLCAAGKLLWCEESIRNPDSLYHVIFNLARLPI